MRKKGFLLSVAAFCSMSVLLAQQPRYTPKKLVSQKDTTVFKGVYPDNSGFLRTYIPAKAQLWDLDDNHTTFIRADMPVLLCFEGNKKNGKREGMFQVYVIDSLNPARRYRIWEQTYRNDKLDGVWNNYTLAGTLAFTQTFRNDTMNGLTRYFEIDGKTVMREEVYMGSEKKYLSREFFPNGKPREEITIENGQPNGEAKKYYETGVLMDQTQLKNGEMNGIRKYYYPNGKLWVEQEYRNGKNWNIIANYNAVGQKRDPGTLRNGNGTVILYNDDGTVRETITYVNGEQR